MKQPKPDFSEARRRLQEYEGLDTRLAEMVDYRDRLEARIAEMNLQRQEVLAAEKRPRDLAEQRQASVEELLAGGRTASAALALKELSALERHNAQIENDFQDIDRDLAILREAHSTTQTRITALQEQRRSAYQALLNAVAEAFINYHGALGDHLIHEALVPIFGLSQEMTRAGIASDKLRGMLESATVKHWRNGKMELLWPRSRTSVDRLDDGTSLDPETIMSSVVERIRKG